VKSSWTTPKDLKLSLEKLWDRGVILRGTLPPLSEGDLEFPLILKIKTPDSSEILDRFPDVQQWLGSIKILENSRDQQGPQVEWKEMNHRQLGRNLIPTALVFSTPEQAALFLGKMTNLKTFKELALRTLESFPQLRPWLSRKPLKVLEEADSWDRILLVLRWLQDHPKPEIYLRQIDLPGIHTKFIDSHKGLLTELMTELNSPISGNVGLDDPTAPSFEARFGFLQKPSLIRFRYLDITMAPPLPATMTHSMPHLKPQEMALNAQDFAVLGLDVEWVIILENEITWLSFPPLEKSLAIFGSGYGFEALGKAAWLRDKKILYWGDLDTHGFAILDQLRSWFPQVQSLLMNKETLMAHQLLWTSEPTPTRRELNHLTSEEKELYLDLALNKLGSKVRLEQERIRFGWMEQEIHKVIRP